MNSGASTLHGLVDKWLGPTPATPARVVRLNRKGANPTRCVCVEVRRPSGLLSVLFFRHKDGSWFVFPPAESRPSMTVGRFAA
jgi:hypothetical protein